MLRVNDFCWTCLAIDYPLVSFRFESRKLLEGISEITIDMVANLEKNKRRVKYAFYEKDISYKEQRQLTDELFKFVKEMINDLR